MSILESWLETITIPTLLQLAPHGFLLGCGTTSEYLAFVMRSGPTTDRDLFEISRLGLYYDTSIDLKEFLLGEIPQIMTEIKQRLDLHDYVRISFHYDGSGEEISSSPTSVLRSIMEIRKNPPAPLLFDHSFVLFRNKGIWRFESYLDQYAPRCIPWDNYEPDLIDLFKTPQAKWEEIFGVKCNPEYDSVKVSIVINN